MISIKRLGPEQICNGIGGKVYLDQSPLDKQCTQTELAVAQPLWCSQAGDVEPRVVGQRLGCSHWKSSLGMLLPYDLGMKAGRAVGGPSPSPSYGIDCKVV